MMIKFAMLDIKNERCVHATRVAMDVSSGFRTIAGVTTKRSSKFEPSLPPPFPPPPSEKDSNK